VLRMRKMGIGGFRPLPGKLHGSREKEKNRKKKRAFNAKINEGSGAESR